MSETKTIGKIEVITDTERGYEQIGDLDGGFDLYELKRYIKKHGHKALTEKLTVMHWQVWETVREINAEIEKEKNATIASRIENFKVEPLE